MKFWKSEAHVKKLKKQERSYYAKLLRNIILNPKSDFYEDLFLIKQWIKLQKGKAKCPKTK